MLERLRVLVGRRGTDGNPLQPPSIPAATAKDPAYVTSLRAACDYIATRVAEKYPQCSIIIRDGGREERVHAFPREAGMAQLALHATVVTSLPSGKKQPPVVIEVGVPKVAMTPKLVAQPKGPGALPTRSQPAPVSLAPVAPAIKYDLTGNPVVPDGGTPTAPWGSATTEQSSYEDLEPPGAKLPHETAVTAFVVKCLTEIKTASPKLGIPKDLVPEIQRIGQGVIRAGEARTRPVRPSV